MADSTATLSQSQQQSEHEPGNEALDLQEFPEDLISEILGFTTPRHVCRFSAISKLFASASSANLSVVPRPDGPFTRPRRSAGGSNGGSMGRVIPRRRASVCIRKCSDSSDGVPIAAASDVQRERSWRVRDLRSLDINYQSRLPLLFGTEEDAGQMFDKMPLRVLSPNRGLISISDQKECVEKVLGVQHNPQDSVEEWPKHSLVDLTTVRLRRASFPDRGAYTSPLGLQGHSGKQRTTISEPFQILIVLISGKSMLQWVRSSDHVQNLKLCLKDKAGIPTIHQRLLYEGKQLEDSCPLSFYNIQRNASITLSLRLRGGAVGQSSSAAAFSYKDAVHSQKPKEKAPSDAHKQEKSVPPAQAPKPFLVDKLEETPSIEVTHPTLDEQTQKFAEHGIICRFNGLWPRTADLYQWIHSNWTNNCKVLLCSKGFFITVFAFEEDYQKALKVGPWFWGSAGLFLTPWFPDFDPSTAIISKLPIWVRLPNLPANLWHFAVFQGIGNSLGRLLDTDTSRGEKGLYTYARICAEIDISKGLPDKINIKIGDFHWTQNLDYENTAFRCRNCHHTGHLQSSCPSIPAQKKKAKKKSKSWKPHDPPPMDDFDFSSDEEEENEEGEAAMRAQNPPSAEPENLSVQPISQKRNHESSTSDSDKEISQSAQLGLQIMPAQQSPPEWVKVGKKKGKKCRIVDSSHVG